MRGLLRSTAGASARPRAHRRRLGRDRRRTGHGVDRCDVPLRRLGASPGVLGVVVGRDCAPGCRLGHVLNGDQKPPPRWAAFGAAQGVRLERAMLSTAMNAPSRAITKAGARSVVEPRR